MIIQYEIQENKTAVFQINEDKYRGNDNYTSESLIDCGIGMYSIKEGHLWEHNDTTQFNKFYGANVISSINVVGIGEKDSIVKQWETFAAEVNIEPTLVEFRTETDFVQTTDLVLGEFERKEGIFYKEIMRDTISPNTPGTTNEKRVRGDVMRGPYVYCSAEWTTNQLLQLKYLTLGWTKSAGHEFI